MFATHDLEEAMKMVDHIVMMNKAQIEQLGTPSRVCE